MLFTKTQYAGIEIHKLIIHLLKHLSKKYFIEFNLSDEGEYWETGDEKVLQENFKNYTDLINSFASALTEFPMKKGEDFEIYFLRLMKGIQKKREK